MSAELEVEGLQFDTAGEALQHVAASGRGIAVSLEGVSGYLVVHEGVAEKLDEGGLLRAYYHDVELPDGTSRIVSVPVSDD